MEWQPIEIRAHNAPWRHEVEIAIRQGNGFARPIEFETHPEGHQIAPCFSIDLTAAQSLMDDLWRAGLRPALGKQSEGVTAAQSRHLDDMRAITFAKLNIPPPETVK
jgi:hypothetical protein